MTKEKYEDLKILLQGMLLDEIDSQDYLTREKSVVRLIERVNYLLENKKFESGSEAKKC